MNRTERDELRKLAEECLIHPEGFDYSFIKDAVEEAKVVISLIDQIDELEGKVGIVLKLMKNGYRACSCCSGEDVNEMIEKVIKALEEYDAQDDEEKA